MNCGLSSGKRCRRIGNAPSTSVVIQRLDSSFSVNARVRRHYKRQRFIVTAEKRGLNGTARPDQRFAPHLCAVRRTHRLAFDQNQAEVTRAVWNCWSWSMMSYGPFAAENVRFCALSFYRRTVSREALLVIRGEYLIILKLLELSPMHHPETRFDEYKTFGRQIAEQHENDAEKNRAKRRFSRSFSAKTDLKKMFDQQTSLLAERKFSKIVRPFAAEQK